MTPQQRYQQDIDSQSLIPDPGQAQAVQLLQRVYDDFIQQQQLNEKLSYRFKKSLNLTKNTAIKGCYLWGGVGIGNQSTWKSVKSEDYYPWTNYVLRGNRVEETGRNSIIIRASLDAVAEYNVIAYSSRYSTGHNIFNFNRVDISLKI